ncbi:DNA topoisomerase 6 subunit A [Tanacetum coccineum]
MAPNLHVFALVDSDCSGLKVLFDYALTIPQLKWLGFRPSDLDRYKIPEECRWLITKEDIKTTKDLLKEDFVKNVGINDIYQKLNLNGFYFGESSNKKTRKMGGRYHQWHQSQRNDQGDEGSWIKRKLNNIRLKRLHDINNKIEILESQQENRNKEELKAKRLKKVRCYKCKEKGHFVNNCPVWKKKGKAKIVQEEDKESVAENQKPTIGKLKPREPYTQVYRERIMISGDYLVLGTENSFWDDFCTTVAGMDSILENQVIRRHGRWGEDTIKEAFSLGCGVEFDVKNEPEGGERLAKVRISYYATSFFGNKFISLDCSSQTNMSFQQQKDLMELYKAAIHSWASQFFGT